MFEREEETTTNAVETDNSNPPDPVAAAAAATMQVEQEAAIDPPGARSRGAHPEAPAAKRAKQQQKAYPTQLSSCSVMVQTTQ